MNMNMNPMMMNDAAAMAAMINPYELGMYEQPKPRFIFKMPRVVPDQKSKFESDELFRRLGRESEIRYTGFRDRPQEERQIRFQNGCREGHTELAFVASGTNLQLVFNPMQVPYAQERDCDFDKEHGKVHIRSHFIMNGVCVRFRGWLDLDRLDGVGCLEYDERRALHEDLILREQIERYNQRLREFEENKQYRQRSEEAAIEVMRRSAAVNASGGMPTGATTQLGGSSVSLCGGGGIGGGGVGGGNGGGLLGGVAPSGINVTGGGGGLAVNNGQNGHNSVFYRR